MLCLVEELTSLLLSNYDSHVIQFPSGFQGIPDLVLDCIVPEVRISIQVFYVEVDPRKQVERLGGVREESKSGYRAGNWSLISLITLGTFQNASGSQPCERNLNFNLLSRVFPLSVSDTLCWCCTWLTSPPHVERLKMLTVKPLTLTLGYSCSVLDIYMPPIPPISHFIVRVLTGLGDT